MTAHDFAESLLNESEFQLFASLKDVSESDFTAKPIPVVMSMRECVEHLIECCKAVQAMVAGEKYNWGSYKLEASSMSDALDTFRTERAKAKALSLEHFETKPSLAKDFLIAHEFYHVGQICSLRHALNPEWDSYSIYQHG